MPRSMSEHVPTLSALAVETDAFARAIATAYERYGFVVIADHGIEQRLIDECLAVYQAFFALPDEVKRRYHVPGGGGARGYTPFGIETAKGATHHDLKEFWHVGRELPTGHPYTAAMPPNLWVAEVPLFRERTLALWQAFDSLGRRLLGAIARALALPRDYFEDKVNLGNSVLRVLHYPPVAGESASVRAGEHEDINVITLLLGAEEPGLEIRTREGAWLPVNPLAGSIVCNVGDMLQRLTNGVLRSTTHRVVNPAPERAGRSRWSLPFFLHFNPDFEIRTLPSCISADTPDRFPEPITADAYLLQRLKEIRLL